MHLHARYLTAVTLLFAIGAAAHATRWERGSEAPKGTLAYGRPTISWLVWGTHGSQVTGADLYLDGVRMPAHYSPDERRLFYTPDKPLAPGAHRVKCHVVMDDFASAKKEWSFTVAADAEPDFPAPTGVQVEGWRKANEYRRLMGLPDFILDPALCAMAQRNMDPTSRGGGTQTNVSGNSGRTSEGLLERLQSYGFVGGSENVSFGGPTVSAAVSNLMDAPYHRLSFMIPGAARFGLGRVDTTTTVNFVPAGGEAVALYPVDGQTNVPVAFTAAEEPDPRRIHGLSRSIGYVIAYLYSSADDDRIRVLGTSLVNGAGDDVPFEVNKAANDEAINKGAVFILPVKPLAVGTRYTVTVKARNGKGRDISRTWSFTTADERGR